MNWLVVATLIAAVAGVQATDLDNYPDIPEDLFVERLSNRLNRQREQPSDAYFEPDADADADVDAGPDGVEPDFTFQFPPADSGVGGDAGLATSPFVRPPDPRYYHDTRRPMESPLRGSAATQDDDVFELPRVRQTPSTPRPTPRPTPTSTGGQAAEVPGDVEVESHGEQGDVPHPRMTVDHAAGHVGDEVLRKPLFALSDQAGIVFFTIVFVCCSVAVMIVLVIALAWVKLTRRAKAAADVEYPAYGVTGPHQKEPSPTGDRKLAQSAQMYHYQHQKQQIIAMESRSVGERRGSTGSPAESDDDNDEGDYTVYECPGLAPTGEMEVKNPLFHDEPTPATPAPPPKDK